jgi:hypothetical protein
MDICFSIFLRCEEPYPFFWRIWGGTSTESHVKRKHDDLSWFLSFVNGFRGNPFSNASRRWWKLVGIVEQFYGTIMETITGEDANGEWTWWARFLAEQPSQKPHFPMKNTISLIFWDHMAGGCLAHLKITLIPLRSTYSNSNLASNHQYWYNNIDAQINYPPIYWGLSLSRSIQFPTKQNCLG